MPDYSQLAAAMMPAQAAQFPYADLTSALAAVEPQQPYWPERQWNAVKNFAQPVAQPFADWQNRQYENYMPGFAKDFFHTFSEAPRLNPIADAPLSLAEAMQQSHDQDRRIQAERDLGIPQQPPAPVTANSVLSDMRDIVTGNSGLPLPLLGAIKAYHGSPHDFDRFDMSKIGTGEGAQAFGHGLYFADNPSVAQSYKAINTGADIPRHAWDDPILGPKLREASRAQWNILEKMPHDISTGIQEGTIPESAYPKEYADAWAKYSALKNEANQKWGGRVYQVNLDVEPHDLLDWDKPLSEHSDKVKNALLESFGNLKPIGPWIKDSIKNKNGYGDYTTGRIFSEALAGALGGPDAGSKALAEAGIPGIRYLDQGSRSAGEGSHNYVIFDDKLIDITGKK